MTDKKGLMSRIKNMEKSTIREIIFTTIGVFFFGWFVVVYLENYMRTGSLSVLLLLCYEITLVALLFLRHFPKDLSISIYEWTVALAGTAFPLLLRPVDVPADHTVLVAIQTIGFVISFVGLMSLYKSYGTVPANRGIKINGLYKYIRHPLYSGYIISVSCFLAQNFSYYNVGIFVCLLVLKYARIIAEEGFLLKDTEYQEYAKKVKWRLYPYIW